MLAELPKGVVAYKRTSSFTNDSVPKGLLSRHNTKKGTWGLIVVERGSLEYVIFSTDKEESDSAVKLSPGKPGVIEPQIFHKVKLLTAETSFYVEFYSAESSTVEVPKFIDDKNIKHVEKIDDTINTFRGYLIQITIVGVLAMIVGFLLIQVSNIMESMSYSILQT